MHSWWKLKGLGERICDSGYMGMHYENLFTMGYINELRSWNKTDSVVD